MITGSRGRDSRRVRVLSSGHRGREELQGYGSRRDRAVLDPIDTVECWFPDTWGIFVGRRMPSATFLKAAEHGLSMPNAPFAWNIRGDIEPTPYANADTGFPNMQVVPDLTTLPRPAPWAERTAFCLMDAFDGTGRRPAPFWTRAGSCGDRSPTLDALGYQAWVASELEFYLCTPDWQPIYDDHRCWSMTRGDGV